VRRDFEETIIARIGVGIVRANWFSQLCILAEVAGESSDRMLKNGVGQSLDRQPAFEILSKRYRSIVDVAIRIGGKFRSRSR